jgi:thioredoxin reductase (NADPH)
VYGSFKGLHVLVLETSTPGDQAGSRSRIENYLVFFPTGILGQDLATKAYNQAQQFGAEMLITKRTRLIYEYTSYLVKVENRTRIPARKVIITTRVKYRKQPMKNLSRFEGAGVY